MLVFIKKNEDCTNYTSFYVSLTCITLCIGKIGFVYVDICMV